MGLLRKSPKNTLKRAQNWPKKGSKIDRKPLIKSRDFMRGFSVILGVYPQNDRKPPFRPFLTPFERKLSRIYIKTPQNPQKGPKMGFRRVKNTLFEGLAQKRKLGGKGTWRVSKTPFFRYFQVPLPPSLRFWAETPKKGVFGGFWRQLVRPETPFSTLFDPFLEGFWQFPYGIYRKITKNTLKKGSKKGQKGVKNPFLTPFSTLFDPLYPKVRFFGCKNGSFLEGPKRVQKGSFLDPFFDPFLTSKNDSKTPFLRGICENTCFPRAP